MKRLVKLTGNVYVDPEAVTSLRFQDAIYAEDNKRVIIEEGTYITVLGACATLFVPMPIASIEYLLFGSN